jgi:hypothetical protein
MKRNSLLLFWLIFVFAVNNFSQTKTPLEVANEFCNLALNNDFESAKKHLESKSFVGIKLKSLKIDFQSVSNKGFNKLELSSQQILPANAKFIFNSKGKSENATIEVLLVKSLNVWKISKFDVKFSIVARIFVNGDTTQLSPDFQPKKQNEPKILPLEPYNEKKNPAKILAEPYYPNKNPATYQFIPKNP